MKATAPYHSPLREAQMAATRDRIVEACKAVMLRGDDLTYAAVAAAAEVQERTVYRHFPTKEDLEGALWQWIVDNLTHADLAATNEEQLLTALRRSFAGFDAGAPLIEAMLRSPQGSAIRLRQQPRRQAMFDACVAAAVPDASPQLRGRASAVLQVLYSASAWELLRNLRGMDGAQAADAVEFGIRSFLIGLRSFAQHSDNSHNAVRHRRRKL